MFLAGLPCGQPPKAQPAESLKQVPANPLKERAGLTGEATRMDQLNDEQQKQLLAWLDQVKDPDAEYSQLGNERERLWGLYYLFSRRRADAAKPYLARAFLKLCCADANWPPAEAHFTWIGEAFREALKRDPAAVNQLKTVIDAFMRDNTEDARALAVACRLLDQLADYATAPPQYDTALGKARTDAERAVILAWKARGLQIGGQMHQMPEKSREAAALYERSMALHPDKDYAWDYMKLLGELGDKQGVDALLPRALTWFPESDYVTHKAAGLAYLKLGAYTEAEDQFRQTLDTLVPGYELWQSFIRVNLAEVYLKQGKTDQARALAREALAWNIFAARAQRTAEEQVKKYFEQKKQETQFTLKPLDLSDMTFEALEKGLDTRGMGETLEAMKQRRQKTQPVQPHPPVLASAPRNRDQTTSATAAQGQAPPVSPEQMPGLKLSEAEASRTLTRLLDRVYTPNREFKSLRFEFTPQFDDLTDFVSRGGQRTLPDGIRMFTLHGFGSYPLYEPELTRAARAVFTWQRPDSVKLERHYTTVELFDKDGQPIRLHPALGPLIGRHIVEKLMLNRMTLAYPGGERCERHWTMDAPRADRNRLMLLWRVKPDKVQPNESNPWRYKIVEYALNMTLIAVEDSDSGMHPPNWTMDKPNYEFQPLGQSGKVGLRVYRNPWETTFEWTEIGGAWAMRSVGGSAPAFDPQDRRKRQPWSVEFRKLEVNPEIPPELLAWPERQPLMLDFSSPDAATSSVLACIREDRPDLLRYCYTDAPLEPPPTRAPYGDLSYRFEKFKAVAASLRVKDKQQAGDHWIYTIELLEPLRNYPRTARLKLVQKGSEWRAQNEGPPLLFKLIYD